MMCTAAERRISSSKWVVAIVLYTNKDRNALQSKRFPGFAELAFVAVANYFELLQLEFEKNKFMN